MAASFIEHLQSQITELKETGLFKTERVMTSRQSGTVSLSTGQTVINLCANNYLGLADHPDLIAEGQAALADYGYGMSSVRFICGTQNIHKALKAGLDTPAFLLSHISPLGWAHIILTGEYRWRKVEAETL